MPTGYEVSMCRDIERASNSLYRQTQLQEYALLRDLAERTEAQQAALDRLESALWRS